jgi:hypothetical protein
LVRDKDGQWKTFDDFLKPQDPLEICFGYPCTCVFRHIGGSMTPSPKSTIMKALTGKSSSENQIDAYIVHGFILLTLVNMNANEIHVEFDITCGVGRQHHVQFN